METLGDMHDTFLKPRALRYDPRIQADMVQFSQLVSAWQNNMVPLSNVLNFGPNIPNVRMTAFVVQTITRTPVLWVPYNNRRLFVFLSGDGVNNKEFITFDKPASGFDATKIAGITITATRTFAFFSAVSIINDIWVTTISTPKTLIAFEGTLTDVSDVRKVDVVENGRNLNA